MCITKEINACMIATDVMHNKLTRVFQHRYLMEVVFDLKIVWLFYPGCPNDLNLLVLRDTLTTSPKVCWQKRLKTSTSLVKDYYASVGKTDCRSQERTAFLSELFLHKFSGTDKRYRIALSLTNGNLGRVYGALSCGYWPDLNVFSKNPAFGPYGKWDGSSWQTLQNHICVTPDNVCADQHFVCAQARALHERCNAPFKSFNILSKMFQHIVTKHAVALEAIMKLVTLMIGYKEFLFTIWHL